jgi:hypothetical protein
VRVEEAWRDGLDVIATTDHLEYLPHKLDVSTNYDRSYEIARAAAQPIAGGDFGGEPQNYEFEWYYQPDQGGISPPLPEMTATDTNWHGWIQFPTPPLGTNNG